MKRILLVVATCAALFFAGVPLASAQLEPILDPLGIADTSISMSDVPGQVDVGEDFSYRLTARNNGPSAANGVLVQTRLAQSLDFVSASGEILEEEGDPPLPDVDCETPSARLVNCRIGTPDEPEPLPAGRRARIFVTVTPTAAGFPKSRGSVESSDIDLRPANNDTQEGTVVR
jgi:uncharacterized repeat protein (TIGR01451 family)